jgi:hypothetical protein
MASKGKKTTAANEEKKNKTSEYDVKISRRWEKKLEDLPEEVQDLFELLHEDLRAKGPFRKEWPNYSPLENDYYHCHLNRDWVAVWEWKKKAIVIRIEYIGSRGEAPYSRNKSN